MLEKCLIYDAFEKCFIYDTTNKPKMAYNCNLADMDYHGLSWTAKDCHGLYLRRF